MSILNWVYIAGWMVGVIWWWSIYLKVQERGEEPLDLAGSLGAATETVTAVRRTTTAARLKAIFGDPDSVDAFTGYVVGN